MSLRTTWLLAITLILAAQAVPTASGQNPDGAEAVDEARERKVMERFLTVLEKTPRRGTALDRVYGYHVERGSLDAFIKGYQQKVAKDPADGTSWLLIGLIEAQRGRDSAAVEAFRQAEARRKDDALPSFYLGQALVLVGQPDSAAEAFERALSRKPGRADLLDVYQSLGRVHQRAHRNDKALAVWDRLEKAFPDDPRVQDQIAHALAEEGQDAAALVRFEALAKSTKDRFRQVQFAIEAAELKVRLGKGTDALADFESLLAKLDPESWLAREVRRKVEEVFLRTDDLAGLASYYERWIKKTPDDVEAMARLGRTLAGQGRLPEARKWFEEAVKLAPSRRELRLALIEQLVQDRKFADAAGQYEALAKLEPNNPDVVRDWGRMLLRDTSRPEIDRKQAAAVVWRKLAPKESKDAVMIAQAADLFRQAGLSDEAIGLYQRAIQLAPESSQYREYLGEYYHALKRPADALATWRGVAGKDARTLGRLGEVLAGFGYRTEALEPLEAACKLEPDDFDLRLKLADLKLALDRPTDSLQELAKAEKSALADEQTEAVLDRLIRAYQASNTLTTTLDALRKSLATTPTAAGWTRLARLLEADQKAADAAQAITEATKLDPKSIPAWVATARLREAAGDLLGSAEALRTLTKLDRRSRTDYLTGIAKIEARLGRRGPALEAGRELLAAAPGNPDHHRFFADLCFQLGEPDEGLDALRRASRANPSDPKAMLTLAENLARQFRAEEAIELYWRAFAKTTEVEAKLSIVARMTDQYLQRNQLDRLLARLERELREPNQQRELALSLAQAHSASGDFATARIELERLLATNARDIPLLIQLSNLAENEGDLATAAKYQKQALDIAPSAEGNGRLAQLYLKSGDMLEAEGIWTRGTEGDSDPGRALTAIDSLISSGKRDAVLTITTRLLRTRPDDWELLYREGATLAAMNRDVEADARFRAILALKLPDDAKGLLAKSRGNANPNPTVSGQSTSLPVQDRFLAAFRYRTVVGIDVNNGMPGAWEIPRDFGQGRVGALAWRLGLAYRENRQDAFVQEFKASRERAPGDIRLAWDWYYLQAIRSDYPGVFEAARELIKLIPADESAEYVFLASLANRNYNPNGIFAAGMPVSNGPHPENVLQADDLDRLVAAYRMFAQRRPDMAPGMVGNVLAELQRGGRTSDADQVYRETMTNAMASAYESPVLINLAAERGDSAMLLAALEKIERKPPTRSSTGVGLNLDDYNYGRWIGYRGAAKAYPDVLGILDRYLATSTRVRTSILTNGRPPASRTTSTRMNNRAIAFWSNGQSSRGVAIDFPLPNDRHDVSGLSTIRSAYEVFRRDDLLSDLYGHLQKRIDQTAGLERADLLLTLGYCLWWNEEKDEAVEPIRKAVEVAGPNPSFRLILAEVLERQGALAEALATIDGIDTVDSTLVQKIENVALRLSVATGNVDRARKSAERLFGLRLDSETQVQLAALMNQLGMRELAEAVLARARREAGNKPASLVSLMRQYQQQQKTDLAIETALQIIRLRPIGASPALNNLGNPNGNMAIVNNEETIARREAIQLLSRSGKLKEVVARTEAQLERSPNSIAILQTLVEYARLTNDRDKIRSLYERMAKARPDDLRLRLQLATQLSQSGDNEAAVSHFQEVLKGDPQIYGNQNQLNVIQYSFRQAGKIEDFAKRMNSAELRAFNNSNVLMSVASSLLVEPQIKDQAIVFFLRVWNAYPADRTNFLNYVGNQDEIWRIPEVYTFARELLIPPPTAPVVRPWIGFEQGQGFNNNGKIGTLATRLLESAVRQNRLAELEEQVRQSIASHPNWSAGKVWSIYVALRRANYDQVRKSVRNLMPPNSERMPTMVRTMIIQELQDQSMVQDLVEEFQEAALADFLTQTTADSYENPDPIDQALSRYRESGRLAEARQLLIKAAKLKRTVLGLDADSLEIQRISRLGGYAQQLVSFGFAGDAVQLYLEQKLAAEALGRNPQAITNLNVDANVKAFLQQAQAGLGLALHSAKPDESASALAFLLKATPDAGKATEGIDLALSLGQESFDREAVVGGIVAIIRKMATPHGTPTSLLEALDARLAASPDDFSANVLAALLAFQDRRAEAIEQSLTRLIALIDRTPLEPLPPARGHSGRPSKPNARQKADAGRQVGLWLVARECWTRAGMKERGDRLAARAVEASRRHADGKWTAPMLREWGQVNLDLGDRTLAEQHLSELLDLVIDRPEAKGGVIAASARENFDKALIFARMTSDRGLPGLSRKAVREAFKGGSPQGLQLGLDASNIAIGNAQNNPQLNTNTARLNARLATRVVAPNDPGTGEAPTGVVAAKVADLADLWARSGVPPREIYEVLRDVVLPVGRPAEVDYYPLGLALATAKDPRSLGARLARASVAAGAVEELQSAIEARKGGAISEVSALVLRVRLDLAAGQVEGAAKSLERLENWLKKDTLQVSAELAAHAALPALEIAGTRAEAARVLELAIKNLSTQTTLEPISSLILALGGSYLDDGRLDDGRRIFRDYAEIRDKALNQGANRNIEALVGFNRRTTYLWIAAAYAKRGKIADSLEMLGQYADIPTPQYVEASPNGTLAFFTRHFAALPAAERYAKWKEWTLPTSGRARIRTLISLYADGEDYPVVFGAPRAIPPGGAFASTVLLVEAASEAGKLDELAEEVRLLDAKSVEEAGPLLILIEIARGKGSEVVPRIEALAVPLEQPTRPEPNGILPPPPLTTFLIVRACLADEKLSAVGERLALGLVGRSWLNNGTTNNAQVSMQAQLRRALLRLAIDRATGHNRSIGSDPGLACWTLAESETTNPFMITSKPFWFEHAGHIGLQSPNLVEIAALAYSAPLSGTFAFSADFTTASGDGEAAIEFGDRRYASRNNMMNPPGVFNVGGFTIHNAGMSRAFRAEGFQRFTLQVAPGKVSAFLNGQLIAEDTNPDPTSPWLMLVGRGKATWRNLELTGKPEIPRELRLIQGDRLGGWSATAYVESIAPPAPPNPVPGMNPLNLEVYDWVARDGEIRGRRLDESASLVNAQSRLAYGRALCEGESITYSFRHEPGRIEVHPALGRLAFLIENEGVKLHWMTDSPGLDPSGLAIDNRVDDPSSRRGPAVLPLKADAWNELRLSLKAGKVAIELNGELIFERPLEPTDNRTFGLFHFKDRTAVQVRDVVLRGDWPEQFEAARLAGLTSRIAPRNPPLDPLGDHAAIGEAVFVQDVDRVLERTRALPDEARFDALTAWVLPALDHPTFRLQGTFRPLDPAPSEAGRSSTGREGEPESPAIELVEVARGLGRLETLATRVEASSVKSSIDERGRLALIALIRLAQEKEDEAVAALLKLQGLAGSIKPTDAEWSRWPELVAAWSSLDRPKARRVALDVLKAANPSMGERSNLGDLWRRQLQQVRAKALAAEQGVAFGVSQDLGPWLPVSSSRASLRGRGFPRSWWSSADGVWSCESGRGEDALLFKVPLQGDFEATCELSAVPGRMTGMAFAGISPRLQADRKMLQYSLDSVEQAAVTLPPIDPGKEWLTWKVTSREGRVTFSIDGRVVLERSIPTDFDPWLSIEARDVNGGAARNFQIVGKPRIPDRIRLSNLNDLGGWSSSEYTSTLNNNENVWRKRGDEIFGRSLASRVNPAEPNAATLRTNLQLLNSRRLFFSELEPAEVANTLPTSSKLESVLRYRRPMVEDGSITYEFYHEPGKTMVHPTLGRLVFLIQADGLAIHRLTDGAEERSGLDAANLAIEADRRKGPASPPLRPKAWNKLTLTMKGPLLTLILNDELIYERPIEADNPRTFGLFHYANEFEARVRNVEFVGGWPLEVPPLAPSKRE